MFRRRVGNGSIALQGLFWAAFTFSTDSRGGDVAPARIQFNRDIRPVLLEKCFTCHGPDSEKRKAGLRLDLREAALSSLKSGKKAIVPGKPAESELVARIFAIEESERMPLARSGKTLAPGEKELLKRWIEQGAEYQAHWSFQPLERLALPKVRDTDWPRNPIDHFILNRLEHEGLAPSPAAEKTTLLRRVTLDLTGLRFRPSGPEEMAWAWVRRERHS